MQNKEGTIFCIFTSWYYIINQKNIQSSQRVQKKFNFVIQAILLVKTLLVHKSRTKNFPSSFCKMIGKNNIKKNISINDTTFQEIRKPSVQF